MNRFIIVLPEGVLLSEERAKRISRELYCVTSTTTVRTYEEMVALGWFPDEPEINE